MPELRRDPVNGRWVIIASERAKRPNDFIREPVKNKGGFCPFCEGNESKTPPEILAYRPEGNGSKGPDGPGWILRVVPNKFPALEAHGELERSAEGIYDRMSGIGAHEVIIESPQHDHTFATMPEKRIEDAIYAYRDRTVDLRNDKRFKYALIFKNHGEAAGATMEHTHSQLIALPVIPGRVKSELKGAKEYFDQKDRCIFCDIVKQELKYPDRVVLETERFVVICPYAARFPFETWLLPKKHDSAFDASPAHYFADCAKALKQLAMKLDAVLDRPAWNLILHTSPLQDAAPSDHYHWHMEIIPKLVRPGGFEWGAGFYINPTSPEESAQFLREAKVRV